MRVYHPWFVFFSVFLCGVGIDAIVSNIFGRRDVQDAVEGCEKPRRIAMAIVGGAPLTSQYTAPYVASIGERLKNGSIRWFCGGSILTSDVVLTAAHCLIDRKADTVRIGSLSSCHLPSDKDYSISKTSLHPGYKYPESYDDIALVKLDRSVSFSGKVRPVCLADDDEETHEGKSASVFGWGAEESGGDGSHILQKVQVEIFTNSDCDRAYSNSSMKPKSYPRGILDEQLCAGSSTGGKDACQGDSGGPLVLPDENGVIRQVGIVSSGSGCGFKTYPGVYARVSSYGEWIRRQLRKESSDELSDSSRNRRKTLNTHLPIG